MTSFLLTVLVCPTVHIRYGQTLKYVVKEEAGELKLQNKTQKEDIHRRKMINRAVSSIRSY
ncbi:hypothetical protein SAMN05216311_11011 [Chitinophaga sp. CF418]|nr:hypothetical protein SAMN05216311_11011 [Chitinophaga sp. CF418]